MPYKERQPDLGGVKKIFLESVQETKALLNVFDNINKIFSAFRNALQKMLSIFEGIDDKEDQTKLLGIEAFIKLIPTENDIEKLNKRLVSINKNLSTIGLLKEFCETSDVSLTFIAECCKKEENAQHNLQNSKRFQHHRKHHQNRQLSHVLLLYPTLLISNQTKLRRQKVMRKLPQKLKSKKNVLR